MDSTSGYADAQVTYLDSDEDCDYYKFNSAEPMKFDRPESIAKIYITRRFPHYNGNFTLADMAMPHLREFYSTEVGIRGLDKLLATTRDDIKSCESAIWCNKGEWFVPPTVSASGNRFPARFHIVSEHGCYEFGVDTSVKADKHVEYIKILGRLVSYARATIIDNGEKNIL